MSILIVDDNLNLLKTLANILESKGYAPMIAATAKAALTNIASSPAVALIDLKLDNGSGLELLKRIKQDSPATECILLTGHASQSSAIEAVNLGAFSYLEKPYNMEQLLLTIQRASEKHYAEQALRTSERNLIQAQEIARTGSWEWDILTDKIRWSNQMYRIYGLDSEIEPRFENMQHLIHPDDRSLVEETIQSALDGQGAEFIEYRIVHPDGKTRFVHSRAELFYDESGKLARMVGVLQDITERKLAESLQSALYRIAAIAGSEISLDELYGSIHQIVSELMAVENFYVALYDPVENLIHFPYFVDQREPAPSAPYKAGKGITEYVIRTGKPLLLPLEELERLVQQGQLDFVGPPSPIWLGVPLKSKTGVFGVMAVQHYSDPNAYGEQEKQVLTFVSGQVAAAIERKRAEQALRESQDRFRRLSEVTFEGIAIHDQGVILDANQTFATIFGYESSEIIGKNVLELAAPESRDLVMDKVRSGYEKPYQALGLRKDGSTFPGELHGKAYTYQGRVVRVTAARDITERKKAEEALQHYVERLRIQHEVDSAILAAESPKTIAQSALQHIRELIPCTRASILLLAPETREAVPLAIDPAPELSLETFDFPSLSDPKIIETLKIGDACAIENLATHETAPLQALTKTGIHSLVIAPLTAQDKLIGVLHLCADTPSAFSSEHIDIAHEAAYSLAVAIRQAQLYEQIHQHALDLTASIERLKELDRLKSEFIQNVSHELRQPLALIRGYAELLANNELGELKPEQQEPMEIIVRRTQMLSHLVEDITLILVAERRELEPEPVPIDSLVHASVVDFQKIAERAGLTLISQVAPGLSPARGQSIELRRVLDNLIGNAIKFTQSGGTVTVQAWQKATKIHLSVADTGIGISSEQQPHIFDRFYQIDGSSQRKYGGVGLGLALVKELIEIHNGQVHLESQVGQGSTFTIVLPTMESE